MPEVNTTADVAMLTADEVVRLAGADVTVGLSAEEAASRLAADGPNSLTARKRVCWERPLLLRFADPLVHLLLAAFAVTMTVWLVDGGQINGDPTDVAFLDAKRLMGLSEFGGAGLVDPSRPEARDAIANAQRAGIRIVMITGDHPATTGPYESATWSSTAGAHRTKIRRLREPQRHHFLWRHKQVGVAKVDRLSGLESPSRTHHKGEVLAVALQFERRWPFIASSIARACTPKAAPTLSSS